MKNKVIIAHRGASAYEKDNTLESFKRAIDMGVDFLEFDIRKTKDNVFIAYHDPKLGRKLIRNTSYSDLNKLGKKKKGLRIPKVEDIVNICKDKENICFDVHLKEADSAIETAHLMDKLVGENRVLITSEHMDALVQIRKKFPKLKLGYIMLRENPLIFIIKLIKLRMFPRSLIKSLQKKNINFLVPYYGFVGKRTLKEAKKANVKILPWTLNQKRVIRRFLKMDEVYGILTDKPDLVEVEAV